MVAPHVTRSASLYDLPLDLVLAVSHISYLINRFVTVIQNHRDSQKVALLALSVQYLKVGMRSKATLSNGS